MTTPNETITETKTMNQKNHTQAESFRECGCEVPRFVTDAVLNETEGEHIHAARISHPVTFQQRDGNPILIQMVMGPDEGGIVTYSDENYSDQYVYKTYDAAEEAFKAAVDQTADGCEDIVGEVEVRYRPGGVPVDFERDVVLNESEA